MKTVILCGGKGTRLREETEFRPKPMLPIGGRPILWHIMKTYAWHGHNDFVLCLGYKGDIIRDYFRNYQWHTCDITVRLGNAVPTFHNSHDEANWSVTLADTGENSLTAYRIRLIKKYIGNDENFLLTYGDGVGNIDIGAAIKQHTESGAICTLTAVRPPGRFGELGLGQQNLIDSFNEKPQAEGGFINGGYMVCHRSIFDYLPDDPNMMLEQMPLKTLAAEKKLSAYLHYGFWQPMDTLPEFNLLNSLWATSNAPWKVW